MAPTSSNIAYFSIIAPTGRWLQYRSLSKAIQLPTHQSNQSKVISNKKYHDSIIDHGVKQQSPTNSNININRDSSSSSNSSSNIHISTRRNLFYALSVPSYYMKSLGPLFAVGRVRLRVKFRV